MLRSNRSTPGGDGDGSNDVIDYQCRTGPRAPKTERKMHANMTPSVQKTIIFKTPGSSKKPKGRGKYKAWLRKTLKSRRKNVEQEQEKLKNTLCSQALTVKKVDSI